MRKFQLKAVIACTLLTWLVGQTASADQMAIVLNPTAAPAATNSSVPGYPGVQGMTNIWTAAPAQWAARADGPYSIGQIFTTGSSELKVSDLGTMAYTKDSSTPQCCGGNIYAPSGASVPTTYSFPKF